MRAIALILFSASGGLAGFAPPLTAAAPVPKHLMKPDENADKDRLQGRWKLESLSLANMAMPVGKEQEMTLEISGNTMTSTSQGQISTATLKLDTADGLKRLATTNTHNVGRNGKPAVPEVNVAFGYTLDGDRLVLATNMGLKSVNGTPADPAKPGDDAIVLVLTRVTDKK